MDWPSVFAGAGAAAALIGTGLIPYLKQRGERRASLRSEAAEERSRRMQAEEELDASHDALTDAEDSAAKVERLLGDAVTRVAILEAENESLRAGVKLQNVIDRLILEPGGEIARVLDASRDLWLLTRPANNGEVIMALGPWGRIGIAKELLIGQGWRSFVAPESRDKAIRVEASALAAGGRAALWYQTPKGCFCLSWVFGRYNGETLAVARVIAYRKG